MQVKFHLTGDIELHIESGRLGEDGRVHVGIHNPIKELSDMAEGKGQAFPNVSSLHIPKALARAIASVLMGAAAEA